YDRVPGGLALPGGFQQEGAAGAAIGGEPAVERDGGVLVGQQPHRDGDDPLACGELAEGFAGRGDLAQRGALTAAGALGIGLGAGVVVGHRERSFSVSTAASRSPPSKQVSVPRWQAAPTWSTCTSRVSPSQSRATERTNWTWPEVSPLRQYSPRERDQ